MNLEEFQKFKLLTDEQVMGFIQSFNEDKQREFIQSAEFQQYYNNNRGSIKFLSKNVEKHNISFLLKLVLDMFAESLLDNFKTFLDPLQERIYQSNAEGIQHLLDELNRWEEGIQLPVFLISQELSTHFSEDGDKETLKTESLIAEWDAIKASCSILRKEAFNRLKNLKKEDSVTEQYKIRKRRPSTEKLYQEMKQWYTNCRQIDSMLPDAAIESTCQKFNRSTDTVERALGLKS